jgi:hypothetical protein
MYLEHILVLDTFVLERRNVGQREYLIYLDKFHVLFETFLY